MDLNLFNNGKNNNHSINEFIDELKNAIKNMMNKKDNITEEYYLYEKRKRILDNISRKGNELAWVLDDNSVCISEEGDGGPVSISVINLPENVKVGEVYEKINGLYIYNSEITKEINDCK